MDPHALTVLEFGPLLDTIGGYAQTSRGRALVQAIRPALRTADDLPRSDLYADVLAVLDTGTALPGVFFDDPEAPLRRAAPEGAVLDGPELQL